MSSNTLAMLRETSFCGVTAFLSSVLLQTTPGHHASALPPPQLPRRFLPAAHAVFSIVNNAFMHSREQAQELLAERDMRTELLYCVSTVVAHCTEQWGDGTDAEVRTGRLVRLDTGHERCHLAKYVVAWCRCPTCRKCSAVCLRMPQ